MPPLSDFREARRLFPWTSESRRTLAVCTLVCVRTPGVVRGRASLRFAVSLRSRSAPASSGRCPRVQSCDFRGAHFRTPFNSLSSLPPQEGHFSGDASLCRPHRISASVLPLHASAVAPDHRPATPDRPSASVPAIDDPLPSSNFPRAVVSGCLSYQFLLSSAFPPPASVSRLGMSSSALPAISIRGSALSPRSVLLPSTAAPRSGIYLLRPEIFYPLSSAHLGRRATRPDSCKLGAASTDIGRIWTIAWLGPPCAHLLGRSSIVPSVATHCLRPRCSLGLERPWAFRRCPCGGANLSSPP